MAKKKKTIKDQLKDKFKTPSFIQNPTYRLILSLTLIGIGLCLAVAFISYLIYGTTDQSKLDIGWLELVFNSNIKVENSMGKTGAYFAHLFLYKWFGIASFSFIFILFLLALRLINLKILPLGKTILSTLYYTILLSVALSYFFIDNQNDSFLYIGGAHGYFMSRWLISIIGSVGTFFLLLICFLSILLVRFSNSMDKLEAIFKSKAKEDIVEETAPEVAETPYIEEPEEEVINNDEEPIEDIDLEKGSTVTLTTESPIQKQPIALNDDGDLELQIEDNPVVDEVDEELKHQDLLEDFDPTLDLSHYEYPLTSLLEDHQSGNVEITKEELNANKDKIIETLRHYKIEITQISATIGPTVTLYEIVPAPGIRVSKIKNLEDDIALSLAALGIRIIAPIPGKGTIGIEVPNSNPEIVSMKSIIESKKFQESKYALPVALGRTISNETYTLDLTKMPHLLVAGATGQGKSVGLNAIITSLLYKKHPSQLKFVLIDPKKVELSIYSTIEKHFLAKLPDEEEAIITDIHKVIATLNSLCIEMDTRYDLLKKAHVRNIKEYNAKFISRKLNPEKGHRYLPYIVVIIDEFADLIMTAGKEVEAPIARIAQLARAIGIHMIIATQRPSTNIITGVIKANFPARIAFKVASMIDSRTILDSPGANQLIGRGDMLISTNSDLVRVQCAFVDTPEVEAITNFIEEQQSYPSALLLPEYVADNSENTSDDVDLQKRDALFEDVARLIVSSQQGSTSNIQRRFSIGYNRAGRIMDQMEAAGIVGPNEGSKARQVLIPDEYSLEQLLNSL